MKIITRVLALVAALIASMVALAGEQQTIVGPARVIDGDTIEIGAQRIRLWGIDAPEMTQQCVMPSGATMCGQDAKRAIAELIDRREVSCEQNDSDRYGRNVAVCVVNPRGPSFHDLNREMVAQGWAVDYARYSHGEFAREEAEAQRHKLGVWSSVPGGFVQPETWRREHRGGAYRSAN